MRGLALIVLVLGLSAPASAQDAPSQDPAPEPVIDATKLGVSLSRIQKGLRTAESNAKNNPGGLRLEFEVHVFGQAPRIDILKDVDLFNGPVPGTAPTHRQFIEHVTPPIYRQPAADLFGLAFWAAQHFWEKGKKARCEDEIKAYRELIMQGVSVSAPRCTQ